ncbi:MAG: DUF1156 domain-containing protein [Pseudomonadota bacterium]
MPDRDCPRLIGVALPIQEISAESVRDKSLRHGHISTLHLWWARRSLAELAVGVENADHPRLHELFDPFGLSAFHETFAASGLPLGTLRRALEAYASDPNPVTVLICEALASASDLGRL